MANNIQTIYDNRYNSGVNDTKKGNATVSDVLRGKTFTSANGVNLTGTCDYKYTQAQYDANYTSGYNAGLSNGSISSCERITLTNNVIPNDCKILLVETLAYTAYGGYYPGAASCTVSGNGTVHTLRNLCPSHSPVNSMVRTASFLVLNAQGQTISVKSGTKTNVGGSTHYFKLS